MDASPMSWTPPPGPALDDSQTRVAHRRWRREEWRRLVLTWGTRIGALALLVSAVWGLFVDAGWWFVVAFCLAIWCLTAAPGGHRGVPARVREVTALLTTRPWTLHAGGLEQTEGPASDTARWTLLDAEGLPVALVDASAESDHLAEVVHTGAPLWTCASADGVVGAAYVPHRAGGRLFAVRAVPPLEPAGRDPVVDPELVDRAWQTWRRQRTRGVLHLCVALVAGAVSAVLIAEGWGKGDGTANTAIILGGMAAGLVAVVELIIALVLDAPGVVLVPRVRRRLTAEPWQPFEGQVLHHSWLDLSGEGESTPTHRWVLVTPDDTRVLLLDTDGPTPLLGRVMAGDSGLWVTGSLGSDPLVLAPAGPALHRGRTLRTERQRERAEGRSTKLLPKAHHSTERSPRMPPR